METDKTVQPPMETKVEASPLETDKTVQPPMETKKVEPTSAEIPLRKGDDSKPEGAGEPTEPKGADQDVKSLMGLEDRGLK